MKKISTRNRETLSPMSQKNFIAHFQGMEDLALSAINSFLENLPQLTKAIEDAIYKKNPAELEIAAHSLKGVLANFFAEPSKQLANDLEKLGHEKNIESSDVIFKKLKIELERLVLALLDFKNKGQAA